MGSAELLYPPPDVTAADESLLCSPRRDAVGSTGLI